MNPKNLKHWLFVLILSLLPLASAAQNIDVKGTVVDASGEPIMGAVVKVKGTEKAVVTNVDGDFHFSKVSPCKSQLDARGVA